MRVYEFEDTKAALGGGQTRCCLVSLLLVSSRLRHKTLQALVFGFALLEIGLSCKAASIYSKRIRALDRNRGQEERLSETMTG